MKYDVMNLSTFLAHYFGIENENLSKLTHKDIKDIFPLKRISFDELKKNKHLLLSGSVIVVRDCKGKEIPYVVPKKTYNNNEVIINYNTPINYDINIHLKENSNCNISASYDMEASNLNIQIETFERKKISSNDILDNIHNMTNWELRQLLMKYKDLPSIYYRARQELIDRGVKHNKGKIKKEEEKYEKRLIIEFKKNDWR